MEKYRIIFYDKDLQSKSGQERLQKIIKSVYWKEDVENWQYFDGELKVEQCEPFGGRDAAILTIENGKYEEMWTKEIMHVLRSDVFRIEILRQNQWEII